MQEFEIIAHGAWKDITSCPLMALCSFYQAVKSGHHVSVIERVEIEEEMEDEDGKYIQFFGGEHVAEIYLNLQKI